MVLLVLAALLLLLLIWAARLGLGLGEARLENAATGTGTGSPPPVLLLRPPDKEGAADEAVAAVGMFKPPSGLPLRSAISCFVCAFELLH